MKKILLALCLTPMALWAQQNSSLPQLKKEQQVPVKVNPMKIHDRSAQAPAKTSGTSASTPKFKTSADIYDIKGVQIGMTTYDLQTNNSLARRIILHEGGQELSVVWSQSDEQTQDFTDRGTAYTHFNGTDWTIVNDNRFEPQRAGWPNIAVVQDGSVKKELIVSHYAEAGANTLSGGTFWMMNSGIGETDFDTLFVKDVPKGPLWPRIAVTGDKVHMIAVYNTNTVIDEIRNPVVYYRYNMTTKQFEVENQLLPGYDKTRYAQGSADEYSIDARDSIVTILMSGALADVALWKSTDYGQNWTKTIVDTNTQAPIDIRQDTPFDTVYSNDGTANVTIDKDGVAHVFYSKLKIINLTTGDSSYSFIPDNSGLSYWNDKDQQKMVIGSVVDYNNDQVIDIQPGTFQSAIAGYGGNNLVTFPMGSIGKNNEIFCIFSAPVEYDMYIDGTSNYKDVYIVFSTDGGKTWSEMQAITQNLQLEDVYATVTRDADDNLHMTWMQDENPGVFLVNNNIISENKIMYASVPVDDILNFELGLPKVGISENRNDVFSLGGVFPNPASNMAYLQVNMKKAAVANVQIMDMLGHVVADKGGRMLSQGSQNIMFDVNELPAGIYFFNVTAGGFTTTQKLVIER